MRKLFRKPVFWVILVIVLLVVIVIDLTIQYVWVTSQILSGKWSLHILGLGLFSILLDFFHNRSDPRFRRDLKMISRASFWVAAIWVLIDFGFLEFLFFSATAAIASKIIKTVLKKIVPHNRNILQPIN